jgi:hypothetical protein
MPENAATNSEGSLIVPDETPMNEFELAVPLFSDVLTLPCPMGVGHGLRALAGCWGSGVLVLLDKEAPRAAAYITIIRLAYILDRRGAMAICTRS